MRQCRGSRESCNYTVHVVLHTEVRKLCYCRKSMAKVQLGDCLCIDVCENKVVPKLGDSWSRDVKSLYIRT